MNDKLEFLCDQMKKITSYAMLIIKQAYDSIFTENPNEAAIVGYLNYANSLISTAKAIYISNVDILEHNDIDEFFDQFDTFTMEVLNNIAEKDSHQWSSIEYDRLKKAFDCCVLSQ